MDSNPSNASTDGPSPAPGQALGRDAFVTTRWTMVVTAGHKSSPRSDTALAELCHLYWSPLYGFVRRRGHSREEAEDLVQAFFEKFLARNYLEGLSASRGRFRAFLLAALKHFLANEWDRARRLKRGGAATHLSFDWQDAEERWRVDPSSDTTSPERAYDRAWALALLDRVVTRLREECFAAGKSELFDQCRCYLVLGAAAIPYAEAAARLGLDDGGVRTAVHRLRKRYRELLREELAHTLVDPGQVQEELRSLRAALAQP